MMKRLREESAVPMAHDCRQQSHADTASFRPRVFSCKTCNREFSSFQALGGHRASHRKPKTPDFNVLQSSLKPKTHDCSICGLEFPLGQALGGHMRRHRNYSPPAANAPPVHVDDSAEPDRSEGSVVGLDLNLTPLENDLVRLHLMAPPLGCRT